MIALFLEQRKEKALYRVSITNTDAIYIFVTKDVIYFGINFHNLIDICTNDIFTLKYSPEPSSDETNRNNQKSLFILHVSDESCNRFKVMVVLATVKALSTLTTVPVVSSILTTGRCNESCLTTKGGIGVRVAMEK